MVCVTATQQHSYDMLMGALGELYPPWCVKVCMVDAATEYSLAGIETAPRGWINTLTKVERVWSRGL